MVSNLPGIRSNQELSVSAVRLPRIDGVVRDARVNRRQPRNARQPIISSSENREQVMSENIGALSVNLVLVAALGQPEKSIAACNFKTEPRPGLRISRTEAGDKIVITGISRGLKKRLQSRAQPVGNSQINGIVSVPHIECSRIRLNKFNRI